MARLTDNQKSLVILGGGLLFAVGFGILSYMHWGDLETVRTEIAAKEAEKKKNEEEIARARGLKNEFVAFGKIVADNAKILPTEEELNQFIRDLGELEKETGITIRVLPSYVSTKDKRVDAVTRVPMKLQISATSRNFLRFLNMLENRERLVTVTDFRVNPSAESVRGRAGQDLEHEISLSFDVYKFDPAATKDEKEPLVSDAERMQLLEQKEVKDILEKEGKPAFLERYQLLRAKESRRDLFVDPRRRTGTGAPGEKAEDLYNVEVIQLEKLRIFYEKSRLELDGFRVAEQSPDFLRRTAAKRAFLAAKDELEAEIKKVSGKTPEFQSRDLQDRYIVEVKRAYESLIADAADLIGPGGGIGPRDFSLTEEMAQGFRKDMQTLMDARKFAEALEKWVNVEALEREAGKRIDEPAKPHMAAIRKMGEHARHQVLFAQRKMDVQGVVRMRKRGEQGPGDTVSAVIINGRILFPGKNMDKDLVFRGVGEEGQLLFTLQGHEVDYLQPKPDLLATQRAILEQD